MTDFFCPRCKRTHPAALRFVPTSDWCSPCVDAELFRQERERDEVVHHQVVEYDPEDD